MSIRHRIAPRYKSRNHEIIAGLREAAGAGPPVDPKMAAKKKIAEAATLLALSQGGNWRVQFEPENGLIQISRRRRHPRQNL